MIPISIFKFRAGIAVKKDSELLGPLNDGLETDKMCTVPSIEKNVYLISKFSKKCEIILLLLLFFQTFAVIFQQCIAKDWQEMARLRSAMWTRASGSNNIEADILCTGNAYFFMGDCTDNLGFWSD